MLACIGMLLLLSGCMGGVPTDRVPITPETAEGIWGRFFLLPLVQFITFLYGVLGNNLGFAVIAATIIARLVTMPLTLKANQSSVAMQAVQPEMNKLKKKYEKKTDQESRMKMNKEMSELYKKHGVNPAAGCLPLLIQMPLFMAFFQAISRHPLIVGVDSTSAAFFGLDLAATSSPPNYVIAVVTCAMMFFSQKFMQKRTKAASTTTDGNQQMNSMMNTMLYVFPLMMLPLIINSPVAMGLYFLTGQVMQTVQSLVMKRPMGPTI